MQHVVKCLKLLFFFAVTVLILVLGSVGITQLDTWLQIPVPEDLWKGVLSKTVHFIWGGVVLIWVYFLRGY